MSKVIRMKETFDLSVNNALISTEKPKISWTQSTECVVFWRMYPSKQLQQRPRSARNSPVSGCGGSAPFTRGCYDTTVEMCERGGVLLLLLAPPAPWPSPRGCRPLAVFTGDSVCSLHSSGPSSHNGESLAAFHCLRHTRASAKKRKKKNPALRFWQHI